MLELPNSGEKKCWICYKYNVRIRENKTTNWFKANTLSEQIIYSFLIVETLFLLATLKIKWEGTFKRREFSGGCCDRPWRKLWNVFLFRHPQPNVVSAALRGVGNIVTGDDTQTQVRKKSMLTFFHQMIALSEILLYCENQIKLCW